MTKEKFCKELMEMVKTYLPKKKKPLVEMLKVNKGDNKYTGLVLKKEDNGPVPVVNLDLAYSEHKKGTDMETLAKDALAIMAVSPPDINAVKIAETFEEAAPYLMLRIMNAAKNAKYLENVPHRTWSDLAVVCDVRMLTMNNSFSCVVTNDLLDKWQVSEDEAFAAAQANMAKQCMHDDLDAVLSRLMGEAPGPPHPDAPRLVFVSVEDRWHGAAAITLQETLKEMSTILGGCFYILPSSVHETLCVPENTGKSPNLQELKQMVVKTNKEKVSKEEWLSDNIYLYDPETDTVSIAA